MRNSSSYVLRYVEQIRELQNILPQLRVVVGEGDSTDDTRGLLEMAAPDFEVVDVSHGGPVYGSVDNVDRWSQIAKAVRTTLDAVGDYDDALIWVESDLIWSPGSIFKLVANIQQRMASCPMVLSAGEKRFYDTWGYRLDKEFFLPQPPYWPKRPYMSDQGLARIDSCGSCFAICGTGAGVIKEWDGTWPFRPPLGMLWLDPTVEVHHP